MKNKKVIIAVIALIVISAIIITILNFVKDRRITESNVKIIKTNYETLSEEVKKYNEIREKYQEKRANFVLVNYEKEHEEYQTILKEYNKVMKNIDTAVYTINTKCNKKYNDQKVSSICGSYQKIYEKLVNLYVGDLNSYNKCIEEYNEYKEENLDPFEMVHLDYIDYNKDNVYEGRDLSE